MRFINIGGGEEEQRRSKFRDASQIVVKYGKGRLEEVPWTVKNAKNATDSWEVSNAVYWHTCFLLPALMTLHSRGAPAVSSGGGLTSLHLPAEWLNLESLVYYVTQGLLALLQWRRWSQNAPLHHLSIKWPCPIHLLVFVRSRQSHSRPEL